MEMLKRRLRLLWRLYRRLCPSLSRKVPDKEALSRCLAAMEEESFATVDYYEGFWLAERSEYLKGNRYGWQADFVWLIQPRNLTRVLREQYSQPLPPLERKENRACFRMYCDALEQEAGLPVSPNVPAVWQSQEE